MILTLREMADRVLEKADLTATNNTTFLAKVNDWINLRYFRIARSYTWPALGRNTTLALTEDQIEYVLDRNVDELVAMVDLVDGVLLTEATTHEFAEFFAISENITDNTSKGQPRSYQEIRTVTCKEAMTIADTVEIVSSSTLDLTPNCIRIRGLVSGVELSENIVLTGTTAATSSNTYDSGAILEISKGTTDGTANDVVGVVTVRETTTATNIKSKIAPGDSATPYKWARISPVPCASPNTLTMYYKKAPEVLDNVNSIPEFDCSQELIQGGWVDFLINDNDPRAAIEEQRFVEMVKELWRKVSTKPDYNMKFSPKLEVQQSMKRRLIGRPYDSL